MRHISTLLLFATALTAQTPRDAYRAAHQAWRQADPLLENKAGTPAPEFPVDVQRSADAAKSFATARTAFLASNAELSPAQQQWAAETIVRPQLLLAASAEEQRMLANATQFLSTAVTNFAAVRDPAIQQVRQAMERERAAIAALTEAMSARRKSLDEATGADQDAARAHDAAVKALLAGSTARAQITDQLRREAAGWETYYNLLLEGATLGSRTSSTPARAGTATVAGNLPGPNLPGPNLPAPAKPAAQPRSQGNPSAAARFTGAWMYAPRGAFFGAQPETIDLNVSEENGRVTGTLRGRFVVPAGSGGDPAVQFTFSGELQTTRNQTFPLQTADGTAGTVELIPGGAFNLLEVNFQMAARTNKIRTANFVLVKK
ncbi:MAG: hypothetical protein ABI811_05060 [Acidobacteriota bacterium]